jgi:ADP-ribosyl-[dinitrogen reductase] hydrolase
MSAPRTSATDPIRVSFVNVPAPGALGMTFAPGKVQPNAATGAWNRDLEADLHRLQNVYGAQLVVSVIEARELRELFIPSLAGALGRRGIGWLHIPVPDGQVTTDIAAWVGAMRLVHARIRRGATVIVHCKGGLGRTGTFAASVLTTFGRSPSDAVATVRKARPGALETREQEAFVTTARDAWRTDLHSRVRGCLLGGAVGDALGAPVEFATLDEIRSRYGEGGVRDMRRFYGREGGAITDDTQMTLFTAEGLLRATARFEERGICDPPSVVKNAYYRWLWTQGTAVPDAMRGVAAGWLFIDKRLHSSRAPGGTCLSALSTRMQAELEGRELPAPINDSKGCGGVMRVAPVGLVANDPWDLAARCAELTHGHPAGYDTAAVLAEIISETVHGLPLAEAAASVWTRRRSACHEDTRNAVDAAFGLLRSGATPTPELVETLGKGWVAEEALAISLYCALGSADLETALTLAVTHSGDSDSTGAIAGNLLGAALGEGSIPARWLEVLELRDVVERIADDVAAVVAGGGPVDRTRYPPC